MENATNEAEVSSETGFIYLFGPFRFLSELEIVPLEGGSGSGRLTVRIALGKVAAELPGAAVFDRFCQVAPAAYLLDIPAVARFLVEDGREVRVQLAPGGPMADVCTYLLGSIFGALCHQNGLLPLHASAIEQNGAVTAFLGESGAGKSTMAACLQARGRRIISDDICLLEEDEKGLQVTPVAGWLKLWRQSLNHLGERPDERNRVLADDEKYRVYLAPVSVERPKLRNIVLLERAEDPETTPRLEPLTAVETIGAMMRMTYLAYVVALTQGEARLFQRCAQVLSEARGYRLIAPWGLDHMEAVLDLVERELLEL